MQVLPATQSDMAARHHELISAHHSGHFAPLPQTRTSLTGSETNSLAKPVSFVTDHDSGSQASFQSYSNLQSMQSGSQTLQAPASQGKWDNRMATWGSEAVSGVGENISNHSGSFRHTHQE